MSTLAHPVLLGGQAAVRVTPFCPHPNACMHTTVPWVQDKELLESALFSAVSDGYERSESIAGSPAGPRAPAHPQLGRSR